MPEAKVKRTINCKKEDLIKLVLNIEEYPKFIPYCLNAKIYENKIENIMKSQIYKFMIKKRYKLVNWIHDDLVFISKNQITK